jgi:2-polyprenyl-3-methyl-5-hydroxy-6-metoxy-1,4-benzoquinol methylase
MSDQQSHNRDADEVQRRDALLKIWREKLPDEIGAMSELEQRYLTEIVSHLRFVRERRPNLVDLIEVGSADGRLLNHVASLGLGFHSVIGSDLSGPRLRKARSDFSQVEFLEGDILTIQNTRQHDGTLFLRI